MKSLIENTSLNWGTIEGSMNAQSKDLVTTQTWDAMSLHHVRVRPGGKITVHTHEASREAHFIISGQGVGIIGDQEFDVKEGDVLLAEKGIQHGVVNNANEDLYLLCIFNPPLV